MPGLRIFSGFLPAAFCALIRRRLAAIFAYSPFPGITFSSISCPRTSSAFEKVSAGCWGSWRLWGASSSGQPSDCSKRRLFWSMAGRAASRPWLVLLGHTKHVYPRRSPSRGPCPFEGWPLAGWEGWFCAFSISTGHHSGLASHFAARALFAHCGLVRFI